MITIPAITAPGQIVQHLVAPAVYLDHWAFRAISSDEGWARRFAAGLEKRQGTLAFSWANVAEFRGVLDEKQARQAEEFINANFPRVFCIQVDPFQIIQREGGGQGSPEADDEVLRALAGLARPPHFITADGLLTVVKGRLEEQGERLAKIFMDRHQALSDAYASDEDFRELVGKAPKSAATLSVLREILAAFLVDRTWKADAHDVMDFYHAVVPSVYCQWVALDKDWAAHVNRAQAALRKAGVGEPLATVVSKRAGVERLIAWLEGS